MRAIPGILGLEAIGHRFNVSQGLISQLPRLRQALAQRPHRAKAGQVLKLLLRDTDRPQGRLELRKMRTPPAPAMQPTLSPSAYEPVMRLLPR